MTNKQSITLINAANWLSPAARKVYEEATPAPDLDELKARQRPQAPRYAIDPDLASGPFTAYNIPQTDSWGVANNGQVNCLVSVNSANVSFATFATKKVAKQIAAAANFKYRAALSSGSLQALQPAIKVSATQKGGVTIKELNALINTVYELAETMEALRDSVASQAPDSLNG